MIVTNGDHSTIGFQSDCVPVSSRDSDNIFPISNSALTKVIVTNGNDGTVDFKPYCMAIYIATASRDSIPLGDLIPQ